MALYGAYVHIPWCRIRCPYCAFVVDARRDRPHEAYADAVLRAWAAEREHFPGRPATVYFGGGTPGLTPAPVLGRLIRGLDPLPDAEVTVEVNPGEIDDDGLAALRDAGVTRVSVGVQSFLAPVARRLGRTTAARAAPGVVAAALAAGFASVTLDLVFAVPGQSEADWAEDLARALGTGVPHVSLYGLTIEPGTPFARAGVPAADDDRWRAAYDRAVDTLGAAGVHRYEVSNFARDGHRSVHNEHYWRARPWAGLGVGAHGWRPDGARTAFPAEVEAFLAAPVPRPAVERPSPEEVYAELVGSTLRHVDGVDRARVHRLTGLRPEVPPGLRRSGLVVEDDASIRLASEGFPVADAIAARLCAALGDSRRRRA